MKIDNYSLKARYFPAVLSMVLPVFAFNFFYTSELFGEFVADFIGAKILSNLTISTIILFLVSQLGRIIGKVFEEIYFEDESKFYTTIYLTYKDSKYPDSYKEQIATKIKDDFDIELLGKEDEDANYSRATKVITVAISHIRKKLFNNKFILQHNIEYGFLRNLVGGSVIGIILAVLNIYFFRFIENIELARSISLTLVIIYLVIILTSKYTLKLLSRSYAKILIREYMP